MAPDKRRKKYKKKKNREIKRESPVGNNLSPRTNNDQTEAGLREKDGER